MTNISVFASESSYTFRITVDLQDSKEGDSLTLVVADGIFDNYNSGQQFTVGRNSRGVYQFNITNEESYGFFFLLKTRTFSYKGGPNKMAMVIEKQFWEKGDDVSLELAYRETFGGIYSQCAFSGEGSAKYTARYKVFSEQSATNVQTELKNRSLLSDLYALTDRQLDQLEILQHYRPMTSRLAYDLIKADILFQYKKTMLDLEVNHLTDLGSQIASVDILRKPDSYLDLAPEALSLSKAYLDFTLKRFSAYVNIAQKEEELLAGVFNLINTNFNGLLRDRLLAYMVVVLAKGKKQDVLYRHMLSFIEDPMAVSVLKRQLAITSKRQLANYCFERMEGGDICLDEFKGKVALIDFWFVGCGYCTKLYKQVLSTLEKEFVDSSELVFLSINIDKDREKWLKGVASGEYTGDRAINLRVNDVDKSILADNKITFFPTLILIDGNRKVLDFNSNDLHDLVKLRNKIASLVGSK
ncbi:thioredoxin family protein [Olivibacter sp. XZL3]|uniref:TlpA family protein disulfide reductase n=1 Tax=Olivibacter sp. XZL3 TaxID=1735116 RepID=UPI0014170822|nr:thioredoxin family protein [Olivibacter sp. XZL3]